MPLSATWIGVIINLCGNVVINISHNSVKYANYRRRIFAEQRSSLNSSVLSSAEQLDGVPSGAAPSQGLGGCLCNCLAARWAELVAWFLSKGRWDWLGIVFFLIGNVANFVSLGFASQSMLAACGSMQFITNVFCEWYFKGAPITRRACLALLVIIIGNTLIVAFANHDSPKLNVDELFRLYFEPAYDVYCVILFAAIVGLYVFYEETKKRMREYQRAYDRAMLARIEAGDPSVRLVNSAHGGGMVLMQSHPLSMSHSSGNGPAGAQYQQHHLTPPPHGNIQSQQSLSPRAGHQMMSVSGDGMDVAVSVNSGSSGLSSVSLAGPSGSGGGTSAHHAQSPLQAHGSNHMGNGVGSGSSGGAHHHLGPSPHTSHSHAASPLPPLPTPIPLWRQRMLPFSYASISAIIGTQSVLLAKSISELLRTTADGRQQFSAYFTWVILAAWLSSILFWMYRMTTALRKFDKEPLIIPVLQVVWTIFSIVGGGIYFEEFEKMNSLGIAFFTLGVVMLLAGVYLLTPHNPPPSALTQQHQMQMLAAMHAAQLHTHDGLSSGGGHAGSSNSGRLHHHLSDVELAMVLEHGGVISPYGGLRSVGGGDALAGTGLQGLVGVGGGSSSVSPPELQLYGHGMHSSDGGHSTSSSGSSRSKEDGAVGAGGGGAGGMHKLGSRAASPAASADGVALVAPGRLTRVTSTGRTIIQSSEDLPPSHASTPPPDDAEQRDRSLSGATELSPDFRPFESAGSSAASSHATAGAASSREHRMRPHAHTSHEGDGLSLDDGSSGFALVLHPDPASAAASDKSGSGAGTTRADRLLSLEKMHAAAMYHAARAAAASSNYSSHSGSSAGILSEAGLLGGGHTSSSLGTPPMRPQQHSVTWGTPSRGGPGSSGGGGGGGGHDSSSRPTSAHGLISGGEHGGGGHSIPPSPALYGYDPFAALRQESVPVKRARGMSLGFSMPMADFDGDGAQER